MAGGYLPPVVASLVGEAADALAKIAEVKAALEDLGKTATDIPITADITEALAQIAALKADARSLGGVDVPVTISSGQADAELLKTIFVLGAIAKSDPVTIPATIDMAPAVAKFSLGAAAMAAYAATIGGSGGGGGLLGIILAGRGGTLGFAKFGSILALAGFGFEHFAATVLGLAGSLAGALVGGLTLAAASFAVMGVGMLTDLAGIGQATGDIKQYGTLQANLNQAIAVYGKNSTEAALAQYQMNQWMQDLAPSTVVAIKAASNTASAFHQMFDQVTGQAEATGAAILTQTMQVGEKFLPIIGKFAAQNMGIIQQALQPLFNWLAGPGLTIFTELEKKFQDDLPYAMNAFTNAVELVIKILGYAAQSTGGFIKWLAGFFAKWNSAAEWPTVVKGINTVVALFHTWWALLKAIGTTIYDVFDKTLGLGKTIVQTVTQMLTKLDQWTQSTSGSKSLNTLFAAHLQEIKNILALLPALLSDFGQLYLMIAPKLTTLVAILVNVVGWLLKIPGAGNLLGWALAAGFLLSRMSLLGPVMGLLATSVMPLLLSGIAEILPGFAAWIASALSLDTALDANPISLIVLGIAALVAIIVVLVTHWNDVVAVVKNVFDAFNGLPGPIKILLAVLFPFITIPALIISHWQQIATFFHNLPGWIMNELGQLPGQIGTFFSRIPGAIWTALTKGLPMILGFFLGLAGKILGALAGLAGDLLAAGGKALLGLLSGLVGALPNILKFFIELPFKILALLVGAVAFLALWGFQIIKNLLGGIAQGAVAVWNWFIALPGTIVKLVATAETWLIKTGTSLLTGLWNGIVAGAKAVWTWLTQLPGNILKFFTAFPGLLLNIGEFLITGLFNGVKYIWNNIGTWLTNLKNVVLGFFTGAITWLYNIGKAILQGLWNGILSVWNDLTGWIGGIGNWIKSHKGPIEADAVMLYPHGMAIMQGLHNGLKAGIPPILATLTNLSAQMGNAVSSGGKLRAHRVGERDRPSLARQRHDASGLLWR